MKKTKRKRLPKDFEQWLAKGADLVTLQKVFDDCDVNARGGYSKGTALMLRHCPEDLARWLVAQGTDLAAVDDFGNTALHAQARNRDGCVKALIELGADVNAFAASCGSPLHAAADARIEANVATLLAHGASVNATNREGLTPLEYALQRCTNVDLERMVPTARALLNAGATRSEKTQHFVQKLGETFEFHRANFNKDSVEAVSNALDALYDLFGVTPVPRRQMHDGKARIKTTATTLQEQYDELWGLLVPSQGAAATVQGEVIRIVGRIAHEIHGNGGVNWDRDFARMAEAFCEHVRSGTSLSADQLNECASVMRSVIKQRDGDTDKLVELAVAWVGLNPAPVALKKPGYSR